MTRFGQFSRRNFMTTAVAAAGSALLPKVLMASPRQDPVVDITQKDGKTVSYEKIPWQVRPFAMKQVRLGEGSCKIAMEADRQYLHSLPPERLLHTFRINAGIASSAQPLGGWEAPDCELRGHYAGGHYLSACALMYASSGDEDLKKNADTVVAGLGNCQAALKSGYLSAFPIEFFDRLRERQRVWAPFYTVHKIMAGLLDMYVYCGNEQALEMVQKMAGWTAGYTGSLSYDHMQRVLGTEYGGMGEVLSNLYAVTGKDYYLEVAQRFDKQQFFDPLAAHRDELKGLHVNTHIPQVIAAARYYELTGESRYREIAEYFWHEVVSERSYCTGGTSNGESWNTDPGKLSTELGPSTTECCCAYNMMKLTRHLFGWSADPRLMDYYERTLFNHRLGTINPEDGTMMYYLPLAAGYWKTFGKPFDSLWCCTGTGSEEYAKLTDTIYFHDADSLYVNLYLDSQLDWSEKGLRFQQETRFPEEQGTTITVSAKNPARLAINLRIPYWAQGGSVKINGAALPAFSSPSSYLTLDRVWKTGDKIELSLPMGLHIHSMPDDETIQAAMYGPLVLAGRFEAVTKDMSYGDYEPKPGDQRKVPDIIADASKPTAWIEPDAKQSLTFQTVGQSQPITLVPLNKVIHERYAVYWKVDNKSA
ncbi:Tat pathway signal sequence domain protein [Candidatus Sulfotelmatobacter kueseliae]|uniref:Tat pathway signal sequence domain protein n=1 Tax=Candidatus Sulfotelmatobacter kueseliae TaxID=2042962 RepID=A0A2U3KWV5_9BACT|nr:Tat pathway signal sequence domain protein [Candidatus Sulfotelmatobacter kueseliae]